MENHSNIKLPQNSTKYIILQRSGYLVNNYVFKFLTLIGFFKSFCKFSVSLKSFFFSDKIKEEFCQDMAFEYSTIKKYLPEMANSILDIGCGVAGIDVLISKHYKDNLDVFLIDKTSIDKNVYYNFNQRGSFYNSLLISKQILEINGVFPKKIYLQEATENNEIKFKENFDIVISLISWGFHYPISTYLEQVYQKLNNRGVLIVDIRANTNGEKEIEKIFNNYDVIFGTSKFIRVLAIKNKKSTTN